MAWGALGGERARSPQAPPVAATDCSIAILSFKLMRSKTKILAKMIRPSQKSNSQVIQLLFYLSVPDLIRSLKTRNGSPS